MTSLRRSTVFALVLTGSLSVALLVAGCSSDESAGCSGASCSRDAASDGAADASHDAPGDVSPDSVNDATQDVGADVTDDGGHDAASDAGDAASDAPADAPADALGDAPGDAPSNDASDAAPNGPVPIASSVDYPWRIAVGGGQVYVTTGGDVLHLTIGSSASETITQAGSIERIAADANNLYFTTLTGVVYKRAHGGSSNVAISNAAVALQVFDLALDATYVYWTEDLTGGMVRRVAIDGGLMAGEAVSPALQSPRGVALTGGEMYVAESAGTTGSGRILRLAADAGTPTALASNRSGASKLVTDGARLYWFDNGGTGVGSIQSIALGGGTIAPHAGTAIDPSLVPDGPSFYYANASGAIVKIDVATSSAQTLYNASQTGNVYGLAVAGNSLYWTDFDGGRVMTAPK